MSSHFILLLGAAALSISLFAALLVCVFFLHKKVNALKAELDVQRKHNLHIQVDIDTLFSASEEVNANIRAVQTSIEPLPSKINQLEGNLREQQAEDPQIKLYRKAASMASQGASADDIASECDLPLAEANVLVSLNK